MICKKKEGHTPPIVPQDSGDETMKELRRTGLERTRVKAQ